MVGSGKNLFRIPDPGGKKVPDPGSGSATLLNSAAFALHQSTLEKYSASVKRPIAAGLMQTSGDAYCYLCALCKL